MHCWIFEDKKKIPPAAVPLTGSYKIPHEQIQSVNSLPCPGWLPPGWGASVPRVGVLHLCAALGRALHPHPTGCTLQTHPAADQILSPQADPKPLWKWKLHDRHVACNIMFVIDVPNSVALSLLICGLHENWNHFAGEKVPVEFSG